MRANSPLHISLVACVATALFGCSSNKSPTSEIEAIKSAREYMKVAHPSIDTTKSDASASFEKGNESKPDLWVVDFELGPTERNNPQKLIYSFYIGRVFVWADNTFNYSTTTKESKKAEQDAAANP